LIAAVLWTNFCSPDRRVFCGRQGLADPRSYLVTTHLVEPSRFTSHTKFRGPPRVRIRTNMGSTFFPCSTNARDSCANKSTMSIETTPKAITRFITVPQSLDRSMTRFPRKKISERQKPVIGLNEQIFWLPAETLSARGRRRGLVLLSLGMASANGVRLYEIDPE